MSPFPVFHYRKMFPQSVTSVSVVIRNVLFILEADFWSELWCETELLTSLVLRAVPWIFVEALLLRDDDVLYVLHRQVVAEGVKQHLLQLIQRQLLHVKLQGWRQRSTRRHGHPRAPSRRQLDDGEMIKMYTTPSLNPPEKSIIRYHWRAPLSFNGSVARVCITAAISGCLNQYANQRGSINMGR